MRKNNKPEASPQPSPQVNLVQADSERHFGFAVGNVFKALQLSERANDLRAYREVVARLEELHDLVV